MLGLVEGLARKFWGSGIAGMLLTLHEEGALSIMSNVMENHPRNAQSTISFGYTSYICLFKFML